MPDVLGGEQIAVANDGNFDGVLDCRNDAVVAVRCVKLLPGSAVYGDEVGTRRLHHFGKLNGVFAFFVPPCANFNGKG